MRTGSLKHLDPAECLRLLGLPEAASAAQIKQAYRALAQRFHPDKSGGDEAARKHFVAISYAYRFLMKTARLAAKGKAVGVCCVCQEFGEAIVGLDGRTRCPECALRPGGRLLLPMPTFVIVKCVGAFALLVACVYLLLLALATGQIQYAAGAFVAGLAALGVLAVVCVRVAYCIQPHEETARRRGKRQRRGS